MSPSDPLPGDDGVVSVRMVSHVPVVTITVPAIHERQASLLHNRLSAMADAAGGRLALGLSSVIEMTSAGINALVAIDTRCRALGGELVLFDVPPLIRHLLRLTRLDRRLALAHDVRHALARLNCDTPTCPSTT